jgi:hypothetical protein
MITTKAVMDSLFEHAADVESLAVLSRFRLDLRACLAPAVMSCPGWPARRYAPGAVRTLA